MDTNLNRVSVIQFLDEPKADDDDEAGAEKRVRGRWGMSQAYQLPKETWL